MKKLILLLSVIIMTFGTMAQEKITQEELDEIISYANDGDKNAQYNLGVCYEYGYGVKKDLNKAKYWYDKAKK